MDLDLASFEQRLRAELQSVVASLARAADSTAPVELDQSSIGRVSRIDAIQQQAMAIDFRNRLQQRQRRLQAALNRVGAGDFGLCCECQDELEGERLEADPATVFCTACLTRREAG
jgi:DnaK suppressor protein